MMTGVLVVLMSLVFSVAEEYAGINMWSEAIEGTQFSCMRQSKNVNGLLNYFGRRSIF